MTQPTQEAGWSWTSCGETHLLIWTRLRRRTWFFTHLSEPDVGGVKTCRADVIRRNLRCPYTTPQNTSGPENTDRSLQTNMEKDELQSKRGKKKRGEKKSGGLPTMTLT